MNIFHILHITSLLGDVLFMITLHYPTEPWSSDLVYGSSANAVAIIQRVERLVGFLLFYYLLIKRIL